MRRSKIQAAKVVGAMEASVNSVVSFHLGDGRGQHVESKALLGHVAGECRQEFPPGRDDTPRKSAAVHKKA